MSEFVRLVDSGPVAHLILNRPEKRNALRRDFIEDLHAAVRQIADNPQTRAMILAAEGAVFCAGMDLGQMQERATGENAAAEYQRDSQVYADLLTEILQLPIPTIAAVQGPALAGGMGLVCACDMVLAAESAYFMLPEPMRGITAAMVTPLLVHRVGPGAASYMLLSNRKISAVDARHMGLCHEIIPPGELDQRVEFLAQSVLTGSRSAFAITKQHIYDCLAGDLAKLVQQSIQVSATARETGDAREGLAAFLEKRKPAWQN